MEVEATKIEAEGKEEQKEKKGEQKEEVERIEQIEKIEEKKEKFKKWIKNPENLALVIILAFSFIVLLYYFFITKGQTLWWDEAGYMSAAKNWAFGITYTLNPQRPPLLSFLAFILYKIGFSELPIKFLVEIVPAWLAVLFVYFLVKEMYDKRTALIATFITSVSWIHLFYAMRFMTDSLSFLFGVLAFFCFWKGYVKKKGNVYIWLIGLFVALSFLTRLIGIVYGVIIVLFLILTLQFNFLKNKHVWISILIFFLAITPYLIWGHFHFGNALAFRAGYGGAAGVGPGWWMLRLVYDYPEFMFFVLFLIGLATLLPMVLSLDRIFLKKDKKYYNDLFIAISIIFTLLFFIFFLRLGENRWLIAMSIGIFVLSAKGILLIYDFIKKNSKNLAIVVLIILILMGAYFQLKHANMIIIGKVPSYAPIQEVGLWVKGNSQETDSVMSISYTQMTYYSERKVDNYANQNLTSFLELMNAESPRYLMFSPIFETHMLKPDILPWVQENSEEGGKLRPVYVVFADPAQTQALVVIYEIIY